VGEVSIGYASVGAGAAGGTPPYKWSVGGGALPPGLSMTTSGVVSGTPTVAGNFTFVVLLQDSAGQAAGVPRTINVAAHLAATGVCSKGCDVQTGCTTVCGTYATLAGGVAPFKFGVTSGALPPGMSLKGTGLSGPFPTSINSSAFVPWQFAVTVTDALGATSVANAAYTVYPHVSLSSGACYGNYGTGCTGTLLVSGGTPGSTTTVTLVSEAQNPTPNPANNNPGQCWTLAATAPPPGYSLTDASGLVTVTIPSGLIGGYGAVWTLTVTSSDLCGPGAQCVSAGATATIGVQCG
jgi:hypothetical protein